jgi:VanZ family protein
MKFESKDFAMWVMRAAWYLAMLAATVLALLPVEHLQLPIFNWWDKAQHALAFAVLTGWALLLWPWARARVLLGMLAYGGGIELAQWAVGWRFAEWADWAADALGVALAWVAVGRAGRDQKDERTAA